MQNKKILWIDTETLSIDSKTSDIIQLAGLIDINGKIVEQFNFWVRPDVTEGPQINEDFIWKFHQANLGVSKEDILYSDKFEPASKVLYKFMNILHKYTRDDYSNKFYIGGYNVRFDIDKLMSMFVHDSDNNFKYGHCLSTNAIDVMGLLTYIKYHANDSFHSAKMKLVAQWDLYKGLIPPESMKVLDRLGSNSHDARTDILQTYLLWKHIVIPTINIQ